MIKFNEMRALLYRPGWHRIKLITIVSGVRNTRVNVKVADLIKKVDLNRLDGA